MSQQKKSNTPGGKGDAPRKGADDDAYRKNYEKIFGNKKKK